MSIQYTSNPPSESCFNLAAKPVQNWGKLIHMTSGQMSIAYFKVINENRSFKIGRHPKCDLLIEEKSISKKHFDLNSIQLNDGDVKVFLTDHSTNGTKVDGQLIHHRTIQLKERTEIFLEPHHYLLFYAFPQQGANIYTGEGIFANRYCLWKTETLGEGSYASVKLAIDMSNGEPLAAKIIMKCKVTLKKKGREASIEREVDILKSISHPNIVQIKDVVEDEQQVVIFLQKVSGGELFAYIYENKCIDEYESKFIFYQLLLAIQYLHERNITHRDLKPENVLLEKRKEWTIVYITDFGMAKTNVVGLDRMNTKCGTFSYLAPEVVMENGTTGYSQKVDCWSLGVILFAMISGSLPFGTDEEPSELLKRIQGGLYEFSSCDGWEAKSVQVRDLISNLLVVDPNKRLSVQEALAHPWIENQRVLLDKLYEKKIKQSNSYHICDTIKD